MVRNVVKSYDLTNPDFRKWWVESALTLVESPNIDGIFIDSLRRHGGYFYDEDKTPTTETYQMLHDVRSRMPEEKMFVGNCLQFHLPNANRHLLECFDGAHTESWDEGSRRIPNGEERYSIADSIEASIQYISEATSKGKMVLLQSINFGEQGEEWDPEEDSKLSLAVFLMVVDQYCYYSFNRSVVAVFLDNLEEKVEYMKSLGRPEEYVQKLIESQRKVSKNAAIISPEFLRAFNRPLGKPKGKYTKEGSLYTREFEHLKVTLDINTLETHFTWAEDADNDGLNDEWELDEYGSVFKKN